MIGLSQEAKSYDKLFSSIQKIDNDIMKFPVINSRNLEKNYFAITILLLIRLYKVFSTYVQASNKRSIQFPILILIKIKLRCVEAHSERFSVQ